MSDFNLAIPTVLRHEGGYVNNPSDPGGETNFGITKRSYPTVDIKNLTVEAASAIYRRDFWDAHRYGDILAQAVATKVFDTAVNMGAKRAHIFLQDSVDVTPDGVLGPVTLARVNAANSVLLLQQYQQEQAAYYQKLVVANPRLQQFLKGWMNRAYDRS